jgi:DNA-binding PadR family transcriptional regulator
VTDSIALPDATSHIVKKYYRLTLRGRDALSPMMDMYTSVQKEFGNKGKDVLQVLRQARSSHALLEVEPDPDVLEDLLRRLERASLIFELDPNNRNIDLSDVP